MGLFGKGSRGYDGDGFPDERGPEPGDPAGDPLGRALGGDFPEYGEYLGNERARAGELALELLERKNEVAALAERLRHKESEVWQLTQVVEGLKSEMRGVGPTIAALREQITALRAGAAAREAAPPPGGTDTQIAALHAAQLDLETRLEDALTLVLDEMNTRRAAEARVRELEAWLAAQGLAPPPATP
jgi:hypothetical protein